MRRAFFAIYINLAVDLVYAKIFHRIAEKLHRLSGEKIPAVSRFSGLLLVYGLDFIDRWCFHFAALLMVFGLLDFGPALSFNPA